MATHSTGKTSRIRTHTRLAQAFETLNDADKRKLYDRGGKEMVEKGGGGGGFNPFGGGGGGGGGSRTKKGKSVSHTLKVTLDELYNGSVRKLRLGAHFMAALTVHAMRPATRGCSTPHRVLTRGALA